MEIGEELKSKFPNDIIKAQVNVVFTANLISQHTAVALKPFGLSEQQFNILRILRGQKGDPVPLKLLSERMIDRMSNTSRLIDKLVLKDLVERTICPGNRRQVDILITKKGLDLVDQASIKVEEALMKMNNLTIKEVQQLSGLLDKMRG